MLPTGYVLRVLMDPYCIGKADYSSTISKYWSVFLGIFVNHEKVPLRLPGYVARQLYDFHLNRTKNPPVQAHALKDQGRDYGTLFPPSLPRSLPPSLLCAGHAKATTKTSSLSGAGAAQLFNRLYIQKRLIACAYAPRTFTIRISARNTTRYEVIIFGWTSPLTPDLRETVHL